MFSVIPAKVGRQSLIVSQRGGEKLLNPLLNVMKFNEILEGCCRKDDLMKKGLRLTL